MAERESGPGTPPPLGLRPEWSSRILAHRGIRLVLDERGGHHTTSLGRRITPGVAPRYGCAIYVEDLERGAGAWFHDLARDPWDSSTWTPGRAVETATFLDIALRLERLVVPGEPSELCIVHASGLRGSAHRLRLTLVRDVALDPADAFDSHPVFSKLFLQTERIETPPGLLLTRRPRSDLESHPVLLFAPLLGRAGCALAEDGWCETDRAALLGRKLHYPSHSRVPRLGGTVGNVLDPMLALRVVARVDGLEETSCAFLLSVAEDAEEARTRLGEWQVRGRVVEAVSAAEGADRSRLTRLGLTLLEAQAFESLGGAMFSPDFPGIASRPEPVDSSDLQALAEWGVSPVAPFVLTHLPEMSPRETDELRRALLYWSELGLGIHAVIVEDDHFLDLPDSVSVTRVTRSSLAPRPLALLEALARLVFPRRAAAARGLTNRAQPELHRHHAAASSPPPALRESHPLEFDNGFGGFSRDGTEYVIRLRADEGGLRLPPRPWTNVLANPRFGCLLSETGAGTTWYGNSREHRITPWRNDPVLDPHDEAFYLLDEDRGQLASAFPGPIPDAVDYEVRHGFGYSAARHEALGLEIEALVFVAETAPFKVTRIRIRNPGKERRRISVASYARLVLGPSTGGCERYVQTEVHSGCRALLARNPVSPSSRGTVVFATAVITGSLRGSSFTGNRAGLLGPERDPARPEALVPGQSLDGAVGEGLDPCFAQRFELELAAGKSCEVAFILGAGEDEAEAHRLASSFQDPNAIERELGQVRASWRSLFTGLQVETPSRALDVLVNGWLPYQTVACRIWGRSAFYQSGGAFGFRDQLQDASSLVHLDPARTREQILLHGSHQFVEGDVLHWWHPPDDIGLRTRFVDDLLWLPLLTASYVESTGDEQILEESLPLLSAPLLEEGEAERFLRPVPAGRSVDLYEHCCLAIDRSLHQGSHGLPLFGAGDWNDGMNRVGIGGAGESVWMGFFLVSVIDAFLPFAEAREDHDRVLRYGRHRRELVEALAGAGWDGEWYRRGYFDDGTPLGSRESDECRIDALVQAWAVLSGVAPRDRAEQALDAAERELISERDGVIRLLTPAFVNSKHDPGYIKGYVAGVRENGGQYTHAALWLIRAFAALGRRDRVARLLDMINPVHLASDPERVARYQLEPYVTAADVYGVDPHVGRGGWSWYTGSSGWMSRVAIESLLGFTVLRGREVRLAPVIPDDWPGFTIRYRPAGGATTYEIRVENPDGVSQEVLSVHCPELGATVRDGAAVFRLEDDGAAHVVRIRLGGAR